MKRILKKKTDSDKSDYAEQKDIHKKDFKEKMDKDKKAFKDKKDSEKWQNCRLCKYQEFLLMEPLRGGFNKSNN